MKINGNEIRPGFILEHDNGLWAAVKVNHVKPGKGGAFAQVELKNLRDGRKLNERFRADEQVERVHLEQRGATFLWGHDVLALQRKMPGTLIFVPSEGLSHNEREFTKADDLDRGLTPTPLLHKVTPCP